MTDQEQTERGASMISGSVTWTPYDETIRQLRTDLERVTAELEQSRATEAELRAKAERADSPTWEHVMDFAEEMERKLSLHRDRGNREGWLIETPRWLFERMLREVVELGDALGYPVTIRVGRATPDGEEPGQECADVANLAMMVRDRMRSAALDAADNASVSDDRPDLETAEEG